MPKRSAVADVIEKVTEAQPPQSIADGIYIGLSSDSYHADPALGSSNIRDLLKGANLFWHKSVLNPQRPVEKKTPSKILGTATHCLLLDGREVFDRVFVRGPWGNEDDDLSSAEKGALTKRAKADLLEGQELLKKDEYDFVLGCKEVIDADPKLNGCLDGGLAEVSIFWTRADGVRVKARHDMLKLRGIGDIKTIANERERPLDVACRLDIATYRYDIPAWHYIEARLRMPELLDAGRVFLGAERLNLPALLKTKGAWEGEGRLVDFLTKVCAQDEFAFQFVFIPKKGAPDAWSCVLSPGNPILDHARSDVETAIATYRDAMARFGPGRRWLPGHAVEELNMDDMPFSFGRVSHARV